MTTTRIKRRMTTLACSLAATAALAAAGLARAADEPKKPADANAAEMAKYAEMSQPGPEHAKLAKLVGEWDAAVTVYMPDGTTSESKGKETTVATLGGRFVEGTFECTMMGMPFSGKGVLGYDKVKKKYINTWADSMGTGIMVFEGTADATGKVITFGCNEKCPEGKFDSMKSVQTMVDDKTYTFEMYTVKDGKETKMMSIKYTKVK